MNMFTRRAKKEEIDMSQNEIVIINMENQSQLFNCIDDSGHFFFDLSENIADLSYNHYIHSEIAYYLNYSNFSSMLGETYIGPMTYNSITLDLIALYLKGQKLLYVEAKTYCEQCLYSIMLPAIFISSACTVLSLGISNYPFGSVLISSLTALNSFLLALITYLKLDAKAEAHKTSAYHFDKLQTTCEFLSGKVLMIKDIDVEVNVRKFVDKVEKKVEEIKDSNQFIIPEKVRSVYSTVYSFNVFASMKSYKTEYTRNKNRLLSIYKEIELHLPNVPQRLLKEKEDTIQKIIDHRNVSLDMNRDIYLEIENIEKKRKDNRCCTWLKT